MRYSILVPVYNVENYLLECLNSIKNQTYKDYELILVDDGSTDNSGKICDMFQQENPNTVVIHKQNEGLISARRVGIQNATGEYCLFCDSDDFFEEDALESINKVVEKETPDMVIFNSYEYKNGKKTIFFENVLEEGPVLDKKIVYDELLLSYKLNSLCLKAVKREIINAEEDYTEFYQCNYGEDLLQSVPLIINADKIYYLNKKLYNYRLLTGMTKKYNPKVYWSYRSVNRDVWKRLKVVEVDDLELKVSINLLTAAYNGTTQLKFAEKMDKNELEKIWRDEEFVQAYNLVQNTKYYKQMSVKQKLILTLLKHRQFGIIMFLLKLKR